MAGKEKAASPNELMAKRGTDRVFICDYRQQWHGKRGKGSSEHQHGKRKRWYEQFYRQDDPKAAGLPKNKLGWAFKRVPRGKNPGPKPAVA